MFVPSESSWHGVCMWKALPSHTLAVQSFRQLALVLSSEDFLGKVSVVSLLEKGGMRYLAIVNRDFHKAMPTELRFDGSAPIAVVGKDRSSRAIAGTDFRETIAPGDMLVLSWRAAPAGL